MEYQKNTKLSDTTLDEVPRFVTKKLVEVYDQSGNAEYRYKPNKQIIYKTPTIRSDLCDFSDVYIVVKGTITLDVTAKANKRSKGTSFKNNNLVFQNLIIHSLKMQKT